MCPMLRKKLQFADNMQPRHTGYCAYMNMAYLLKLILYDTTARCHYDRLRQRQEVERWLEENKQNKKGGREAVQTAVGGVWGSWLYYLDQALFHMSTHLLFAPSQWGTAQRTYLPPLLRLPPLHLPYASWTSRRKEKTEHISLTWSHFFSLIFSSAWIGLSVGNIQSFLYFTPFSVMAPPPHGRI